MKISLARIAAGLLPIFAAASAAEPRALDPALPTLFIAGDSTAARDNNNPDIQGWGEPFADFFDPARVNLANRARAGRSSRTFITEGHWARLLDELKAGDVVLIQFGHNDSGAINREPPGSDRPLRARGSLPGLGDETEAIDNAVTGRHEIVRTFGSYMREMIAGVQARGATPILLSLTVRDLWRDGRVERGSGRYRGWIRQLADEAGLGYVDLTRLIADTYQELGEPAAKTFFTADYVHTNPEGARLNAALVLSGLKGLRRGAVDLSSWLSSVGAGVPADTLGWLDLPEPADPNLPSLFLIGDSTVRNGRGDGAGDEWGWGDFLGAHFDPAKLNLVNRAIGGLSSRTFHTQGHWKRALMLVRPGDFVVMQFGHNDAGPINDTSRARGTLKGTGEETAAIYNLLTQQPEVVHTYGWYLRQFIREARAAGATPVVCSPVPRRLWQDGRIVRSTIDGYAAWARRVAQEEAVPFVDLNDRVAARYEELGPDAVKALFADEHTHTNRAGAELNAALAAAALRAQPGDPLGRFAR